MKLACNVKRTYLTGALEKSTGAEVAKGCLDDLILGVQGLKNDSCKTIVERLSISSTLNQLYIKIKIEIEKMKKK